MAGFTLRFNISEVQKKSKEAQNSIHGVTESLKETNKFLKIVPREASNAGEAITSSMRSSRSSVDELNASFKSLKSYLQKAIPTIGVEEAIRRSITAYADYQTALNNMGKLTDQSFDEIDRKIRSLDPTLGSYTELMQGYYQVISAGVTDSVKAMELLETASRAAKASGVSQADTIKALTSLMTGYAGQLRNSADAADTLFAIERYGKTSVQELVPYIGELSSVARIAGVNINSLGASLSIITQTAGSTATASTQVKALFLELTKESDNLKKILSDLGKENFQQLLSANSGDVVKSLQAIAAQAQKTGTSFASLFGSQEAQIAAKNLIDLASEYQKALEGVQQRAGAMTKAFGTYAESLNGLFATTQSLVSDLAVHIGEAFGGPATKGLESLNEALSFLTENFQSIETATAVLISSLAALTVARKADEAALLSKTKATFADIAATKEQVVAQQQLRVEVLKTELEAFKSDAVTKYGSNLKRASAGVRETIIADIKMMEAEIIVAEKAAIELNSKSKILMATSGAASKAMTGIKGAASSLVSFMGGPVGIALTAAAGAVAYLSTRQSEAEKAAELHAQALDSLKNASEKATEGQGRLNEELSNAVLLNRQIAQEKASEAFSKQILSIRQELAAFRDDFTSASWGINLDPTIEETFVEQISELLSNFEKGKVSADEFKNSFSGIIFEIEKAGLKGSDLDIVLRNMFNDGIKNTIQYKNTLDQTNLSLKEFLDRLNGIEQASSQISTNIVTSLSGINEALEKSRLIAYTNTLTTEQRSVASFLQSTFKDLKPEQLKQVLKGNFQGFNENDAAALKEIIKNVSTPKLKTSTKGTSEIDNAKEKVQQLREEIDRLNGTDVKANTDLSKTIREIESVGAKAKLSGDEIKKLKTDYETAFKTSTLKEFNKELLQAQGNTKELRTIEIVEAVNEWTTRLKGLGLTETEVTAKTNQLREAMNLQSQIKDAQAAADFYRELAQLSGNYGRSQEYVDQLLSLQADNLIRNVGITRELADEWLRLQKIQNSREAWAGAYRATQEYFSEATNLAQGFENLTTNAFSSMEDAIVAFASTGKLSFSDMVNSMISDLIRLTVRANITGPLAGALGSGLSNLFSDWSTNIKFNNLADSIVAGATPSAHGNILSGAGISSYSNSIVSEPTLFGFDRLTPFARGGIMGEAGPEAVMPLVRTSGGNLGVRAEGTGNITPQINIQVINQTGTDATAEVQQQRNAQGGIDVVVMLKREMASDIARGGVLDQTIRGRYGVKPVVRGR